MRKILLIIFCLMFSGCNPYAKFYQDFTGSKNALEDRRFIFPAGEPKLRQGADPNQDKKDMFENGYFLMGESIFNADAGSVNQNDAIKQARIVRADTVIVYENYSHTESRILSITNPSYTSRTIHGPGVTYNIARYDHCASYWIKLKNTRIGFRYHDLSDELRQKVGLNKGIYITLVIKDSPAFNNDLLIGDIIQRVNGVEVIDERQFKNWLEEQHPSTFDFEIYRSGGIINKKIQLQDSYSGSEKMPLQSIETIPDSNIHKKSTQAETNTSKKNMTILQCGNCGHEIGKLEKAYVSDGHIVCSQCYLKLRGK